MAAYATLDDLDELNSRAETDERVLARMETALDDARDRLDEELETDFDRHPADDDDDPETRLLAGSGASLLHVHTGIVELTSVRIRQTRSSDWVTLAETDYDLEAMGSPDDTNQATAAAYPFDHIRLTGTGSYSRWPKGERLVELAGVFGWPAPPRRAVEANVAMARQLMAADRTYPGGVISPDEAGIPMLPTRLPDAVYRLKAWVSNRFASCST